LWLIIIVINIVSVFALHSCYNSFTLKYDTVHTLACLNYKYKDSFNVLIVIRNLCDWRTMKLSHYCTMQNTVTELLFQGVIYKPSLT